jgi:hypothetical protein
MVVPYKTDGTGAASSTTGPPSTANVQPFCSNDAGPFSLGASRISWTGVTGHAYLVQVGGVFNTAGSDSGFLRIIATDSPPLGDNRVDAQTVTAGTPVQADNEGGTEQSGENLLCPDAATFDRPLGSTVWFHFTAPDYGTATFTSTGFDTVIQVYRGSDTSPVACNDDGDPNNAGPSRVSIAVTPGDYFIQVGGFGGVQDLFTLSTEFTVNLDVDKDGSNRPSDCNDNDPNIHPGANDPRSDGVDQNCDGVDGIEADRDGDTFNRPQDCNDTNPNIHPGAVDIPDNGVDEDCNGVDAVNLDRDGDGIPRPRDCNDNVRAIHPGAHDIPQDGIDQDCNGKDAPFPKLVWHFDWNIPAGNVAVLTVSVQKGARISLSCTGSSACPSAKSLKSHGRLVSLKRFFHKQLGIGTRITVRATLRGHIGRLARISLGRKRSSSQEFCLVPHKRHPTKCPF